MLAYVSAGLESQIRLLRGARAFLLSCEEMKICGVADSLGEAVEAIDIAADSLSDAANSVSVAIADLASFTTTEP